jgi:DMSO reductase anchor subunit
MLRFFALTAVVLTVAALVGRIAAWRRNVALVPKSTLQSAIGIKHGRIAQKSQGFMGGSFNTREFFHGRSAATLRQLRWACIVLAFALPVVLLAGGIAASAAVVPMLVLAVASQYLGQLAERWLFFAEANHPQNLYYQQVS